VNSRYHLAYAFAIIGLLTLTLYSEKKNKELIRKTKQLTYYNDSLSFELLMLEDKITDRETEILILSDLIGEKPNWVENDHKSLIEFCEKHPEERDSFGIN
jgi:hypothetical protein